MSAFTQARSGRMREILLPVFLGVILLAMLALAFLRSPSATPRPWDIDSAAPGGALGLRLWLAQQGFDVGTVRPNHFALPGDASMLISFPGDRTFTATEVDALRGWVEDGGVAVLVGRTEPALVEGLAEAGTWETTEAYSRVQQTALLLPEAESVWYDVAADESLPQSTESVAVAVTESTAGEAASAVLRLGDGWVWLLGPAHPLTNASLHDANQVALATALLRGLPPGAKILFDEYHLVDRAGAGAATAPIDSPREWLYRSALGRALLFALVIFALFWMLAGRRLGPAMHSREELRRREAAEYVRAIASLKQRAHTLDEVAAHHRMRLKATLGRSGRVDAGLPDAEFIRNLEDDGALSAAQIQQLQRTLDALARPTSEQAVLKAAADGYELMAMN